MNFRKVNFRSPAVLMALGGVATLALALVVVIALLQTGGAEAVSANAALIGALVALGGVFTAQMVSIALDDRRTTEARDLEAQRANEVALQNYFEQVGKLLADPKRPLQRSSLGDSLSTIARAHTLTVLEDLDPDRKRILLLFLHESRLIHKDKPVVSLVAANLSGANLKGVELPEANLSGANLSGANLFGADLSGADLSWAELWEASLSMAVLEEANLSVAVLSEANLNGAILSGAIMSGANLIGANLMGAELEEANLRQANLREANLSEVDLTGADLKKALGTTNKELVQRAYTLDGAIMPNGQKYEDWLKRREERKEDEADD